MHEGRALNDLFKPFLLEGKVALVTSASSGFGRHFGSVLARAGAKVVLAARRTSRVQEACDDIVAAGGEALAVTMDVTDTDSIRAAFDEAEQVFGVVTVVVNNAGGSPPADSATVSPRFNEAIIRLNLLAPMNLAQRANRVMQEQDDGGGADRRSPHQNSAFCAPH